jgi:hypothetical protein
VNIVINARATTCLTEALLLSISFYHAGQKIFILVQLELGIDEVCGRRIFCIKHYLRD